MRQIILDTETTGLEAAQDHRIIEIGCLELVSRRPTGRHFHRYLNPERDIDEGAVAVHGITRARLPADNKVICTLGDPSVPTMARELGNTRSAAALELWRPHLSGSVVVIGNAPTALFYLLEMLDGCPLGAR